MATLIVAHRVCDGCVDIKRQSFDIDGDVLLCVGCARHATVRSETAGGRITIVLEAPHCRRELHVYPVAAAVTAEHTRSVLAAKVALIGGH